jgi:predicted esterase
MPGSAFEASELFIHVPAQANREKPLRVLLALHGIGGQGAPFAQELVKAADKNNWLLVAPTLPYNDQWKEPKLLIDDDIKLSKRLVDTLAVLPLRLGLKLQPHILIFGFSRGAQLAHHLAYFYPERVESVVVMSAGAYTMPDVAMLTDKGTQLIPLPFGVGDLTQSVGRQMNWEAFKRISFWISVGEKDNQADDVSRAFDPYCGKTRVDRAQAFQKALASLKIDAHLVVFPNAGHEVTQEMRLNALQFLLDDETADQWAN